MEQNEQDLFDDFSSVIEYPADWNRGEYIASVVLFILLAAVVLGIYSAWN